MDIQSSSIPKSKKFYLSACQYEDFSVVTTELYVASLGKSQFTIPVNSCTSCDNYLTVRIKFEKENSLLTAFQVSQDYVTLIGSLISFYLNQFLSYISTYSMTIIAKVI